MHHPARSFSEPFNQTLENRVAKHLSEHDATVVPPLQVVADRGTVTLRGLVDSHATRRAILAIVRQVPGVQRVIDDMEMPAASNHASWQTARYQFSPALARYFEERRQALVSNSAMVWDS
jgi:hypothetical protein